VNDIKERFKEKFAFIDELNKNNPEGIGLRQIDYNLSKLLSFRFEWDSSSLETRYFPDLLIGIFKSSPDILRSFGILNWGIKTHNFGTTFEFTLSETDPEMVKNTRDYLLYLLNNLDEIGLSNKTN
jgi:hypothetical protein